MLIRPTRCGLVPAARAPAKTSDVLRCAASEEANSRRLAELSCSGPGVIGSSSPRKAFLRAPCASAGNVTCNGDATGEPSVPIAVTGANGASSEGEEPGSDLSLGNDCAPVL